MEIKYEYFENRKEKIYLIVFRICNLPSLTLIEEFFPLHYDLSICYSRHINLELHLKILKLICN